MVAALLERVSIMKAPKSPILTVVASTVVWSYVTGIVGSVTTPIVIQMYHPKTMDELEKLLPPLTKLATANVEMFPLFICLTSLVSLLLFSRTRYSPEALCRLTLSVHLLVGWCASLCFCQLACFESRCTHDPRGFDLDAFVSAARGAFPITLFAILAALVASIRSLQSERASHKRQSPVTNTNDVAVQ